MEKYDVTIIGGGILGTTLALWLSSIYEGRIAVLEAEPDVARRTSGRNTGVIHRPFYLHPEKRRTFARCAQVSYGLWKDYARAKRLPWKEVGTLEVATREKEVDHLKKYVDWARQNGMAQGEVEYLSADAVRKLEPAVDCLGAVWIKTDTSVDFRIFTESVKADAAAQGAQFLFGFNVRDASVEKNELKVRSSDGREIGTPLLINCAGGNAVDVAHQLGAGGEYTDLHFRGEYWEVGARVSGKVARNIYTVPKHPDIPFLDPHWIVRSDGRVEIGPNAVLVAGEDAYRGFATGLGQVLSKVFEPPYINKLRLFTNGEFLKLAWEEWRSSIFKGEMLKRVRRFLPWLEESDLVRPGTAGIRSSVIGPNGAFIKEALELTGIHSFHVLNYNSPGATGAPAYTAHLVNKIESLGKFAHLKKRGAPLRGVWDFGKAREQLIF